MCILCVLSWLFVFCLLVRSCVNSFTVKKTEHHQTARGIDPQEPPHLRGLLRIHAACSSHFVSVFLWHLGILDVDFSTLKKNLRLLAVKSRNFSCSNFSLRLICSQQCVLGWILVEDSLAPPEKSPSSPPGIFYSFLTVIKVRHLLLLKLCHVFCGRTFFERIAVELHLLLPHQT